METHIKDIAAGHLLIAKGMRCLDDGAEVTVEQDSDGVLFIMCKNGRHNLDAGVDHRGHSFRGRTNAAGELLHGQVDANGILVGLERKPDGGAA